MEDPFLVAVHVILRQALHVIPAQVCGKDGIYAWLFFAAVHVIPAEARALAGIYARLQFKHICIHQIVNYLETVLHPMSFHTTLQVKADRHD